MEQYFVNTAISAPEFLLDDKEQFRHIITVLRHQIGDIIYFVDPTSQLFEAKLVQIDNKSATFAISKSDLPSTELPVEVTIACSLSKKDKIEWITQKATELGASKIIFFNSRYSIMNWKDNVVEKKLARLNEIAKNAAQQSKRRVIPKVEYFKKFEQLLTANNDLKLLAYEESAKQGEISQLAKSLSKSHRSIIGVFGPEGGISADEADQLMNAGYLSVGLGPRILRAETAPMYLLSVISYSYELQMNEE
ncbi:RsmE family RNA methyltransferase [Companilactobacillus furfuricola]|uniref:RsmE family RNA methyltransferase n=1 Tax=Companilactobacillus furfuricola TaxID=1462575 RepID=UPI000F76B2B0|nr:RsmE family RNA methyltransferase [Companilactobacillus furfuricola]